MRRVIATVTLAATTAVLGAVIGSSGATPLAADGRGTDGLIGCCVR